MTVTRQGFSAAGWQPTGQTAPANDYTYNRNQIYQELLPEDRGFFYDRDSRFNLSFRENLKGSWMRLDYMNATINHTGRLLGTPLEDVRDPAKQFNIEVIDPFFDEEDEDEPHPFAPAQVPTTNSINFKNLNGIRGTFGIPVSKIGWVEGSVWGLEQGQSSIVVPTIPPSGVILDPPDDLEDRPVPTTPSGPHGTFKTRWLATTLTTDGELGDRIILYDRDFFSNYTVDTWSADVNFVYNLHVPTEGFRFQPMVGYRHEEYGERFRFGGTFDNNFRFDADEELVVPSFNATEGLMEPRSNLIASRSRNFRNSLQLGFRSELAHRWFTLGVEPKVAFGSNLIRSQVLAQNVLEPGGFIVEIEEQDPDDPDFDPDAEPEVEIIPIDDPTTRFTTSRQLRFAPSFDMNLYLEAHPTDWLTLRLGWNLIWMGRLGVADHAIRFNEVTLDPETGETAPDVVVQQKLRNRVINAFTVGGVITLP